MNEKDFLLETRHLSVGYQNKALISDICMSLRQGEIVVMIGQNGSGKSTIIKSIIRQLLPLGGAVYLGGQDLEQISRRQLAKSLASVQTLRESTEFITVREVVAAGRYPYTGAFGVLSDEDKKLIQESMELVHIEELAELDYMCISDGQKQRALLARALCQQPKLLVLDEPTSFLDIRYKLEFLSLLRELAKSGSLSVLMSLHELDLAGRIADRVLLVKGDKIAGFGSPEELFGKERIRELFAIEKGSYDPVFGGAELPKIRTAPTVFVLSGCGCGTPVFRRLNRRGIGFITGILWENDLDMPAADALAGEVITVPAFGAIGEKELEMAKNAIDRCERMIIALPEDKMVGSGAPLLELLRYGKAQGKEFGDGI